jgi:hypothetical protein
MPVSSIDTPPLVFRKVFKTDHLGLDFGCNQVAKPENPKEVTWESRKVLETGLFVGQNKKPRQVQGLLCCSLSIVGNGAMGMRTFERLIFWRGSVLDGLR